MESLCFFYNLGEIKAAKSKIYYLKNNRKVRMKMIENAQQRQRKLFSNDKMRELTYAVYNDIL